MPTSATATGTSPTQVAAEVDLVPHDEADAGEARARARSTAARSTGSRSQRRAISTVRIGCRPTSIAARARGHAARDRDEHAAEVERVHAASRRRARCRYSARRAATRARGRERDHRHQRRDQRRSATAGTLNGGAYGSPNFAAMKPVLQSRTKSAGNSARAARRAALADHACVGASGQRRTSRFGSRFVARDRLDDLAPRVLGLDPGRPRAPTCRARGPCSARRSARSAASGSRAGRAATSRRGTATTACRSAPRGSSLSPPASSSSFSMPIGRQRTTTPVMSGIGDSTSTSQGSPSSDERVRDVAVVARVVHRRRHEAVDEHRAGVLVDLVLDRVGAHRDLDDHVAVVRNVPAGGDAVEAHREMLRGGSGRL